jgi:hypothetical protein
MTVANAMERIQKNQECLFSLTQQLLVVHQWDIKKIKPCLKNLLCVDKALRAYYIQEKTGKQMVRLLSLHNNISEYDCAKMLGYKTIAQKIEHFFGTPPDYNMKFCLQDIKKSWYLNATSSFPAVGTPQTLLHQAIEFINLEKVQTVLAAGIALMQPHCENPLQLAFRRYFCAHGNKEKTFIFSIVALLLEKKLIPDDVCIAVEKQSTTPLMKAVMIGDQKMARLLLEYRANPYETIVQENFVVNCFGMEQGQPKGWLVTMYKEFLA